MNADRPGDRSRFPVTAVVSADWAGLRLPLDDVLRADRPRPARIPSCNT